MGFEDSGKDSLRIKWHLGRSAADTDFSLDESLLSSSSDSEAENDEVIDATERGRAEKLNIPTRSEFSMLVFSS